MKKKEIRDKDELLVFFRDKIIRSGPMMKMPSARIALYKDLFALVFESDRCLYMDDDEELWSLYFNGWLDSAANSKRKTASAWVHELLAYVLAKAVCNSPRMVSFGEFVQICLLTMREDHNAFFKLKIGKQRFLASNPEFNRRNGVKVRVPVSKANLDELWPKE